jgi:hypothetical protein
MHLLLTRFGVALLLCGIARSGSAQQARVTPRYAPTKPTVSPYLNLLRNDAGALPNYYSLVRPQLNQARFNERAATELNKQAVEIELTRDEFSQIEVTPTGKASWFFNKSEKSGFRNTSHFFGQWEQRRLQAGQRQAR